MASYEEEIEHVRRARVARLVSTKGWLSLVGKIFLSDGEMRLGSGDECEAKLPPGAPPFVGTLSISGARVVLRVDPSANVLLDAKAITAHELRSDAKGPADTLVVGDFLVQLMERGTTRALRIRRKDGAVGSFAGIDSFPIDPYWRKEAHFVSHPKPVRLHVEFEGIADEQNPQAITDEYESPGALIFDVEGKEQRLDALFDDTGERLFVLFRDATTGVESYGTGRFVYADRPNAEGRVVVDFNRAMLPGCAFSIFATCPIPPPQNRLAVAIRAGEKRYLAKPIGMTEASFD